MKKYYLIYYVDDDSARGCNNTFITLPYDINKTTLPRVERTLRKALEVNRVIIISYRKVEK